MLIGLGVWGAREEMKWIEDKMALTKKDKKAKKKERKKNALVVTFVEQKIIKHSIYTLLL